MGTRFNSGPLHEAPPVLPIKDDTEVSPPYSKQSLDGAGESVDSQETHG